MLKTLQDQHVLVLGLGISGLAMARWCAARGARVTVADTREAPPRLEALREACPDARFVAGPFAAALIEGSDVRAVFRSPGLEPAEVAPVIDAARAIGLWTGSELDLFARALADLKRAYGYQPRVLAVTGTNGKTTVTALAGQLVERAGRRVAVAGNIGPSLLDTLALELARLPEGLPETLPQDGGTDRDEAPSVPDAPGEAVAAEVDTAFDALSDVDEADAADDAADDVESDPHEDREGQGDEDGAESRDESRDEDRDARADAEPASEPAPEPEPEPTASDFLPQVWVLELSSFQLDGVQGFEPWAATVLNITQDHLDWHGDMQAYAAAKQRVFGSRGALLLNRDDPAVMAMWPAAPAKAARGDKGRAPVAPAREVVTFGADMPRRPGDWGIEDAAGMVWLVRALEADETRKPRRRGSPSAGMTGPGFDDDDEIHIQRLMPADALRIRGRHNAANALAALALASAAGCPLAPMLYGLREYRGEPHRVEPVAIVNGVEYFDDSKGTNVGATVAALQGLGAERRVVAILGGEGKGQDFAPLADPVRRFARAVVLIGRDAPLIRAALEATGVALFDGADMADAVRRATERAHAGDAVLLSPACASFDMFDNYAHRGAVFREAVAELARDAGEIAA